MKLSKSHIGYNVIVCFKPSTGYPDGIYLCKAIGNVARLEYRKPRYDEHITTKERQRIGKDFFVRDDDIESVQFATASLD